MKNLFYTLILLIGILSPTLTKAQENFDDNFFDEQLAFEENENDTKEILEYELLNFRKDYDWKNNSWKYFRKLERTYNEKNELKVILEKSYKDGVNENVVRNLYSYDGNGHKTEFIKQKWDNGVWVNDVKSNYAYNSKNEQIEWLSYKRNGNDWQYTYKSMYKYNSNGDRFERIQWKRVGSQWKKNHLYLSTYDPDNFKVDDKRMQWDGQWLNDKLTVYEYSLGKLRVTRYKNWENGNWVNDYYLANYRENKGPLLFTTRFEWQGSSYKEIDRNKYEYNNQNQKYYQISQKKEGSNWMNTTRRIYDDYTNNGNFSKYTNQTADGNEWVNNFQFRYNFNLISKNPDLNTLSYSIKTYPNPTNNQINLDFNTTILENFELGLYNENGQIILSEPILKGIQTHQVNVQEYPNGVYYLQVTSGDKHAVQKIVVQH